MLSTILNFLIVSQRVANVSSFGISGKFLNTIGGICIFGILGIILKKKVCTICLSRKEPLVHEKMLLKLWNYSGINHLLSKTGFEKSPVRLLSVKQVTTCTNMVKNQQLSW